VLKLKFRKLHTTIIDGVDPANIIGFLFQEGVVSDDDMKALQWITKNPKHQLDKLLNKLHTSKNPQTFVKLYLAIKKESHLQWLIERIDNFDHQSLNDLLKQLYFSYQRGNRMFV